MQNQIKGILMEWEEPIKLDETRVPIFDVSIFPDWIRKFIKAVQEDTQTPIDAPVMAALAALSTCIAGNFEVEAKPGWNETLNTYTMMALDPASRKSTVFNHFIKPIVIYEFSLKEKYNKAILNEKIEREAILEKINKLVEKRKKMNDDIKIKEATEEIKELSEIVDEEINPTIKIPRIITSDATQEKLAVLMHDNEERMALLTAEGGEVIQIMSGRYSGKINIDIYLKSFLPDNITIDRLSRPNITMSKPMLTIGLFVQPSVIKNLPQEFANRGLTQRFLFSVPNSNLGTRRSRTKTIDELVAENYKKNITKLLDMRFRKNVLEEGSKKLVYPTILRYEDKASEFIHTIHDETESLLKNRELSSEFIGWLGKMNGQIIRISGLLHVAEYVELDKAEIPKEISYETLYKAYSIRNYLISHTERALGIIDEDQNVEDLKYVVKKLISYKNEGEEIIPYQSLWQSTKSKFKKAEVLKDIVYYLESLHYLKLEQNGKKLMIIINPLLK
ncbi:YfjI family protein [Lysinibacillus sp. 3P01SB]|uniref:YfjI family protein n=1 Tax=Lysinibacillus sp. 3P01SB TaxID=3132284 RepID=UPI0039A4A614